MQILRPNQTFRIPYVIADPNDSTTYYPQLTIRQTLNDTLLLSAGNMTLSSTPGRYYYDWIVPGDTFGGGTEIDITVTVYTDSGHTVLSSVYSRDNKTYNILDLAALMRGGGGSSFDIEDFRTILKKEVAILLAASIPDYKQQFDNLAGNLGQMANGIGPALNALLSKNNSDVLDALSKLPKYGQSLDKILSVAGSITNNLSGNHGQALEGIQNLADSLGQVMDTLTSFTKWMRSVEQAMAEMPEKFGGKAEKFESSISQMEKSIKAVARVLGSIQTVTVHTGLNMPGEDLPKEQAPAKRDYSHVVRKLIGNR